LAALLQKDCFFERLSTKHWLGVVFVKSEDRKSVVIGGKAKHHWDQLEGCFAKSTTHVPIKATSDDAAGLLKECSGIDHCVLIIDFDSITKVDPTVFNRRVEYGRLIPVLVLVDRETTADCESLLRMGCMGFLRPDAPPSQFRRAVDAVTSGEMWAPRKLVSRMCRELLSADDPLKLTAREEEVLVLLAAGHSNRKIADSLFISRDTVRWHMRAIYRKLGVHDRSSVLSFAVEHPGQKRVRRKASTKV
jgi:two-component system nitrate/nitrite response regulator NarL